MYLTDLFPEVVPQTTESSPPHQSESSLEIHYASGILPNGGGLAPSVISFHAPKTSTLLHGQPRAPIRSEAGKRKRTKPAADPSAAHKKPKKHKTITADDLPSIDLDVEQFLDDKEIEETVDDAAANISEAREQTPPADIPVPQKTPPTPTHPTRQLRKNKLATKKKPSAPIPSPPRPPTPPHHESSEHTPSAVGSHHIEEEVALAPAIPINVLADMFSFDIRQFMDEEEEIVSKALVPLADNVKTTLLDISHRLEGSVESLVVSSGSIRDRFHEIQDQIPDELADVLTPVAFFEQHRFKLEKAKQRMPIDVKEKTLKQASKLIGLPSTKRRQNLTK
ncbi:uncharacterized protein LOC127785792 [Oryza glaberrima]|uniref:uncharacterized protein LOC127785792 n=1 Tax=Oryza glaberrima TaxID=4538 RepID=UPI00224BFDCD|nr:uncharacterized protein LOC127785792 [Oryza glaberrima]